MELFDFGLSGCCLPLPLDALRSSLSCAALLARIFLFLSDRSFSKFFSASMYRRKSDFLAALRRRRYSDSRRLATIDLISDYMEDGGGMNGMILYGEMCEIMELDRVI